MQKRPVLPRILHAVGVICLLAVQTTTAAAQPSSDDPTGPECLLTGPPVQCSGARLRPDDLRGGPRLDTFDLQAGDFSGADLTGPMTLRSASATAGR